MQPPHFGNQGPGWLHQSAPTTPCAPPRRAQSEREETANRPGTVLVTMARSCVQQDWLQQASAKWKLQQFACTARSNSTAWWRWHGTNPKLTGDAVWMCEVTKRRCHRGGAGEAGAATVAQMPVKQCELQTCNGWVQRAPKGQPDACPARTRSRQFQDTYFQIVKGTSATQRSRCTPTHKLKLAGALFQLCR